MTKHMDNIAYLPQTTKYSIYKKKTIKIPCAPQMFVIYFLLLRLYNVCYEFCNGSYQYPARNKLTLLFLFT